MCTILREFIYFEKQLDSAKLALITQPNITLVDSFQIFNFAKAHPSLTLSQFIDCLLQYPQIDNVSHAEILFNRYSTGDFGYFEFCKMLLPAGSPLAVKKVKSRVPRGTEYFSKEVADTFVRLLKCSLSVVYCHELLKMKLCTFLTDNQIDLFEVLDSDQKGFVGLSDIERLLIEDQRSGGRQISLDSELLMSLWDRKGIQRLYRSDF